MPQLGITRCKALDLFAAVMEYVTLAIRYLSKPLTGLRFSYIL